MKAAAVRCNACSKEIRPRQHRFMCTVCFKFSHRTRPCAPPIQNSHLRQFKRTYVCTKCKCSTCWNFAPTHLTLETPDLQVLKKEASASLLNSEVEALSVVVLSRSGVGFGGPSYHIGNSREGLDVLGPGLNYRERSGSEGDGEEDSPPPHHRHAQQPHPILLSNQPPLPHSQHSAHSLRRGRSRPGHYHQPTSGLSSAASQALLQQQQQLGGGGVENPYQQPYLGRSGGLSDSPTSGNASDATLTDSELPFANPPLQNGGVLMSGGNLDFLGGTSGRGNSLKRTLNSNGKSTTGLGLGNHSSNHDGLIDQFVMHTPGGKIYIPQGETPKNSTSDYKTSPSSSPSKKTSGSLLYKDTMHLGGMRDSRPRSTKADEDDFLYKFKGFCTWKRLVVALLATLFLASFIVNILFMCGAIAWGSGNGGGVSSESEAAMCGGSDTTLRRPAEREGQSKTTTTFSNKTFSPGGGSGGGGAEPQLDRPPAKDTKKRRKREAVAPGPTESPSGEEKLFDSDSDDPSPEDDDAHADEVVVDRRTSVGGGAVPPIPPSSFKLSNESLSSSSGQVESTTTTPLSPVFPDDSKESGQNVLVRLDQLELADEEKSREPRNDDDANKLGHVEEEDEQSDSPYLLGGASEGAEGAGAPHPLSTVYNVVLIPPPPPTPSPGKVEEMLEEKIVDDYDDDDEERGNGKEEEERDEIDNAIISIAHHTSASASASSSSASASLPSFINKAQMSLKNGRERGAGAAAEHLISQNNQINPPPPQPSKDNRKTQSSSILDSSPAPAAPPKHTSFVPHSSLFSSSVIPTLQPPKTHATGGICECYCPCLDKSGSYEAAAAPSPHAGAGADGGQGGGEVQDQQIELLVDDDHKVRTSPPPTHNQIWHQSGSDPIIGREAQERKWNGTRSTSGSGIGSGYGSGSSSGSGDEEAAGDEDEEESNFPGEWTSSGSGSGSGSGLRMNEAEVEEEDEMIKFTDEEHCEHLNCSDGESERAHLNSASDRVEELHSGQVLSDEEMSREDGAGSEGANEGGQGPPVLDVDLKHSPETSPQPQLLDNLLLNRTKATQTTKAAELTPTNSYHCQCSHPAQGSFGFTFPDKGGGGRGFPSSMNFPPDANSFSQIGMGSVRKEVVGAFSYWNLQFFQPLNQYVTWQWSVPRGASIAFYARRNALPSHTHYDLVQIIRGFTPRLKRSSPPSVTKELSNFLEQGHWFLSLYNDDSEAQEVMFGLNVSDELTEGCPNGCSGNGQCQAGHCQCNAGFGDEDCSQSVCPVLCSGRGDYVNGECSCNPGWKGRECSLRHDECEVTDCSGHGKCVNGKCSCARGFKGDFCQHVDCPNPTCSGHGFCLNGMCMCKKGWRGGECAEPDNEALQCLPDCSSHGVFNLDTQTCTCEPRWTGEDCSQELCDTNCGANGICIGGGCRCTDGWTGTLCNQRVCDKRCAEHGQCKNGTCLCVTGWNGKHCTLEGCPNSCSGHGQCKANYEGLWECKCHNGWTGLECSVMMEQSCNDAKDNDKDGLTDCEDPECCAQAQCEKSQLCVSARKPIDILLRKQPPAITASFFEKMKFLIEEGSLQSYAKQEAFNGSVFWSHFNKSRSGVVRGRVVTPNGSGLMGVRVSSSSPLEPQGGFTLTQDDGWFDLMVNGGGAVTLQFGRSPFNSRTRTIFVPWNEVVIIDSVVMGSTEDKRVAVRGSACESHDYESMKPVVLATWKHGFQGDCPEASVILVESQVVQESILIPGTGLHLMYHSSRSPGYSSTIQLQLTSETIPPSLRRVHLRITIEGVLFDKTFEADPDIKFTYAWNRLNVYRQRVYGVTTAIVKVGYEYESCAGVIWDVQSTTLSGHDMGISDIGGWNLDIHHRYNFHEGIIQKGDGSNIYLKRRPSVILTSMGTGYQRPLDCSAADCNGVAVKQKLLAPVALATSADGTLFVGDFNLIRKIVVDGTVQTIVRLNASRVSYRYHMALSPVDNTLYISDPESHQIIRVRNIEDASEPEHNWEAAVGSGERCLPGDEAHCGDEALARDAKLAYPKGLAVSSDNVLYFADGTNIRKVDRDGIITTVIGNHQQKSHWKPIPCEGTLKVEEVHLRWPTELAVNPLDNSLYIIDDHMVLKLTEDNRVRVIAGRPFHCPAPPGGYDNDMATHTSLISPQSLTFSSNGDLYIAESDSQRISRVRLITTDGRVSHFAGSESKCNCLDRGCVCFEEDHYLAATTKFNTISAIAMSPDGILHISDQGNYRIRSIQALIPSSMAQPSESRQYEVYSPETQEIYIFNRFGQHVATKNIVTGETLYTFLYNVNMSNGKLNSVTDSAGNKLQILRDYSLAVKSIENAQGHKFNLRMSRKGMLQDFSTPEGYNVTFDYHGSSGLIKSRQDSSGRSSVYSYDEFGRLVMAVSPTGQVVGLNFDLSKKGASVRVTKDQDLPLTVLIRGSSVIKRTGKLEEVTTVQADGNVIRLYPWAQTITTETVPYNILGDISPVLSDSFPVPGKQKTEIGGDLVNRVEWRYVARKEGRGKNKQVVQVDKKMRVNGENILMIEYDRETKSELVFIEDRNEILNVTYDRTGRPLKWSPSHGFAPVDLEYDRFGRLIGWKWDDLTETYEYDRSGRLFKTRSADGTTLTHTFKDLFLTLPMKTTTGGGSDYLLDYNNAGAFESLTTPRGHIHTFGISTSIGAYEYQYKSPSSRDTYRIQYNDLGHIVSIVYPQGSGRINYVYNKGARLEATVAGLRSTKFTYHDTTGLLKMAEVAQSSFEVRVEYKYHGGVIKEVKEKYGSKTGLDNVHLKFTQDGNARMSHVDVEVNGKSLQGLTLKRNQNTGVLESVMNLTFHQNSYNRTILQDLAKTFVRTVERDRVNRVRTITLAIKGAELYKLDIDYDARGKVKHRKMTIGRSVYADNVQYAADGHISEVLGSGNWKYVYDENGNAVQIVEQGEKSVLIYDSGDRVIQVGELLRYTYDARGFLIQRGNEKFQYDDKGLLIHAVKKDAFKVWFFYDHEERLVAWKDDQGNVTQFLYANPAPDSRHLITHTHYPLTGKSFLHLYDADNVLVALVSSAPSDGTQPPPQVFYVAADQNGSPLAIFNAHGTILKEIHRTPFGKVVRDTSPDFYSPIDFHGGVVDRHTGLVILRGRPYDPSIGQWMVPSWQSLPTTLKAPTDIFTYRFAHNDPLTPFHRFSKGRMTTLADWLALYGFDLRKIFGQDYIRPLAVEPTIQGNTQLSPEFGALSGLDCMADTVTTAFKSLGFSRESKLNPERILSHHSQDLLSRIAYRRSALGPGLLVSRTENGRTLISTVDNSVVQGVITSVLNGSVFIDFRSSHQSTYYFVKDNPLKLRDDMEELKRLGGLYNVSIHEAENSVKELRLSGGDTTVTVRYGTDVEEEFQRLVKHAHRRAIERAWEEEKRYISMGLDGRRSWTEEEKDQLLSKGLVHGYRPTDLFSIHKFSQLADDPNNVLFTRDTRRKRRKSSPKRHRSESSSAALSLEGVSASLLAAT